MNQKPTLPEKPSLEANLAYIKAYAQWQAQLPETLGLIKRKNAPCARCGNDTGAPYCDDLEPTYCQRCDLAFELWEQEQRLRRISLNYPERVQLLEAELAVAKAKIALLEFDAR